MDRMSPERAIEAILFDADGVIQTAHPPFHEKLAALLSPGDGNIEEFVEEVAALESSVLTGAGDFAVSLGELLEMRRSPVNVDDALWILNLAEVEPGILRAIAEIRQSGVSCYLASNQQRHRAKYMSEVLGYRDVFDAEFYSCCLGFAKPSSSYFERILDALGLGAKQVLFLDDHLANVEGALAVGLHASVFAIEAGADNRSALCEALSRYGFDVGTGRGSTGSL